MTVQVGRLTVRTTSPGAANDAAFRVRHEAWLRALDLEPPGLAERSVLVVRRLDLVDAGAGSEVRSKLADLRRAAARPSTGPVGPDAQAVLFADQVDLLCCLTADLVAGAADGRWYWRQILRSPLSGVGRSLAAVWVDQARWLPATLADLGPIRAAQAVAFLSSAEVHTVTRAMLSAYDIDQTATGPGPVGGPLSRGAPGRNGGAVVEADRSPSPTEAPWRRWLPPGRLDWAGEALLGVALMLRHDPAAVRRPGFGHGVARWSRSVARPPGPAPSPGPSPGPTPSSAGARPPAGPAAPAPGGSPPEVSADRGAIGTDPVDADPTRATAGADPGDRTSTGDEPPAGRGLGRDQDRPPDEALWAADGVPTDLASMFFLANFVAWMGDGPGSGPPGQGWALVDLLSRHLLGAQIGDFDDDPLWDLLAELDGRPPGIRPVVELDPGEALRLPEAWLTRWASPPPSYQARWTGGRLVVEHPEGHFVVADVPCPVGLVTEVRQAEESRLGAPITLVGWDREPPPPAERRWADAVGAFVAWLLRSRGIAVSSLGLPGRVRVTRTHVDVVLRLEQLDLAVRAAGLDRDPGWVPRLGRIVLFHFVTEP